MKDAKEAVQEASSSVNTAARQLLGMKGAGEETNKWKIRLQLTKPVTWVPLIWGKPTIASTLLGDVANCCGPGKAWGNSVV